MTASTSRERKMKNKPKRSSKTTIVIDNGINNTAAQKLTIQRKGNKIAI